MSKATTRISRTAKVSYRAAYFNEVCFAHIPSGYCVVPDDGMPSFGNEPTYADAVELARGFGYTVER